jgi:hypothetical protein
MYVVYIPDSLFGLWPKRGPAVCGNHHWNSQRSPYRAFAILANNRLGLWLGKPSGLLCSPAVADVPLCLDQPVRGLACGRWLCQRRKAKSRPRSAPAGQRKNPSSRPRPSIGVYPIVPGCSPLARYRPASPNRGRGRLFYKRTAGAVVWRCLPWHIAWRHICWSSSCSSSFRAP